MMKTMKKVFALLLTLAMVIGMCVSVSAGKITVNDAVDGQTYTAYKIFDVSQDGNNYSYTIENTEANKGLIDKIDSVDGVNLTLSADKSVYSVEIKGTPVDADGNTIESPSAEQQATADQAVAAKLAETLNANKDLLPAKTKEATAQNNSAVLSDLPAGYYFIDSSLGAVCLLQTAGDNKTINEKNGKPDVDKTADKTTGGASVGDTITYTITVTAGGGADTSYVVTDTLSKGLTFGSITSVKIGETAVDTKNYQVSGVTTDSTTGVSTFTVTFPQTYTSTLEKNTKIVITYTAVVNGNAVSGSENNKVKLDYGKTSTEKTVTTFNYRFDLIKTNDKSLTKKNLDGAEFDLYTAKTDGTQIKLVACKADGSSVGENETVSYYRPATTTESSTSGFTSAKIVAGSATIKGLASGSYWLEETKAPTGYNKLPERQEVKIEESKTGASTLVDTEAVNVVNKSGSELPSTGGIGTTIFYVVGSIMVAGALVLLVVKKRMSNYQD